MQRKGSSSLLWSSCLSSDYGYTVLQFLRNHKEWTTNQRLNGIPIWCNRSRVVNPWISQYQEISSSLRSSSLHARGFCIFIPGSTLARFPSPSFSISVLISIPGLISISLFLKILKQTWHGFRSMIAFWNMFSRLCRSIPWLLDIASEANW